MAQAACLVPVRNGVARARQDRGGAPSDRAPYIRLCAGDRQMVGRALSHRRRRRDLRHSRCLRPLPPRNCAAGKRSEGADLRSLPRRPRKRRNSRPRPNPRRCTTSSRKSAPQSGRSTSSRKRSTSNSVPKESPEEKHPFQKCCGRAPLSPRTSEGSRPRPRAARGGRRGGSRR